MPDDPNDTLKEALPLPSRPLTPRSTPVVVSKKSTDPVGVPELELTFAEIVIVSPIFGELFEAETDVLVLAGWTDTSVEPLDELKEPPPE